MMVPMPPSRTPSTPSVSMRLSVSTPRGTTPSIHSTLETLLPEPEPPIMPRNATVDDIDQLMKLLQDAENARGSDSADSRAQIQELRDLLHNLIDELRQREAPPPPVPVKDVSVGRSSVVSSSELGSLPPLLPPVTVVAPQPRPAYPPPLVEMKEIGISPAPPEPKPIYLSPPRRRGASPETLSDSASFLSSHHSDDWSLMESESYPALPRSLSWSSSEPSSPESSPSESDVSVRPRSALSVDRGATPSPIPSPTSMPMPIRMPVPTVPVPMPVPQPASPTGSTVSSATARPFGLSDIRELLDALRREVDNLANGQNAANRKLDEVRQHPAPSAPDYSDRLGRIEMLLHDLLTRPAAPAVERVAPPPPEPAPPREESEYESSDGSSIFRQFRDFLDRSRADIPPVHMPTPRHAGPTLDERLAELAASEPPPAAAPVQPPPPLVPLIYRPGPRLGRPRSTSPTFDVELPARPGTVPIPEPVFVERSRRTPRVRPMPRPRPAPASVPLTSVPPSVSEPPDQGPRDFRIPPDDRARTPATMFGAESTGPDIDMLREVQRRRGGDGTARYGRPPSAPPDLGQEPPRRPGQAWYQTGQAVPPGGPLPPGVPPPGDFVPGGPLPPGVPPPGDFTVPPGAVPTGAQPGVQPAFVLPPGGIEGIVELLRDQRVAQTASIDQQREIMRYLRALNDWLGRDVQDRQSEIRAVAARVDQLRDLLLQVLNTQGQGRRS
ncbi:uncharacterized protein PHACADRAFT_172686, partial [Phanerochaete carnosa HHB-10118-sp]